MNEYIKELFTLSTLWLFLYITYISLELWRIVNKKLFNMTPGPLTAQPIFTASIRIPIISFIYFGIFSWWGHHPDFSPDGFANFIETGKLPLGLLSLSIPFVAVINNIHRTIQTNKQIQETERKNLVDIYFSHHKNYTEYLANIESEEFKYHYFSGQPYEFILSIEKPNKLYKSFFSKTSTINNDFDISQEFILSIDKLFIGLYSATDKYESITDPWERFNMLTEFNLLIDEISEKIQLNKFKPRHKNNITYNGNSLLTVFWDEDSLRKIIGLYLYVYKEIYEILGIEISQEIDINKLDSFCKGKNATFHEWKAMQTNLVNSR